MNNIEYPAEWVHCNDGDKDERYYFSIDPNNELKARETVISFKNDLYGICEEVYISQGCDNPFIVVSPSSIDIPASSHTFDIQVDSNVDVNVDVNVEWMAFIGKNGDIYSFSTEENNTTENNGKETRKADVIISDSSNTYKLTIIKTGKTTNNGDIDDMEHIEW